MHARLAPARSLTWGHNAPGDAMSKRTRKKSGSGHRKGRIPKSARKAARRLRAKAAAVLAGARLEAERELAGAAVAAAQIRDDARAEGAAEAAAIRADAETERGRTM